MMYHLGITCGISDAQDGKPFSPPILLMNSEFYKGYAIGYESERKCGR